MTYHYPTRVPKSSTGIEEELIERAGSHLRLFTTAAGRVAGHSCAH